MCEDLPKFTEGCLYIVKALDHFTRRSNDIEKLFIEFIGVFIEETEYYFKFVSYYYQEVTHEEKLYSPEIRFVLKSAIYEISDPKIQVITGKFEQIINDALE